MYQPRTEDQFTILEKDMIQACRNGDDGWLRLAHSIMNLVSAAYMEGRG